MRKKYQKVTKEICTEAIIFARVSSEKQERGASIEAQKESIYNYCTDNNLKIIKEYEITESTTRGDRVKYNAMLDFIRSRKKKTAIVVNCVDRLQRSDEDSPALNKLRKEGKIVLHFMKEHIILDEDSPVHDIFSWKMNVLLAGNYTDSLSYNVKRSFGHLWEQGIWPGEAPLGYLNKHTEDNKAIIIVDPERSLIIKKLYQEYATGNHSIQTIWELAKGLGLTSKRKKRKGCPVCMNTVYDILTNPFYTGEMIIKGVVYKHIYEPLVSKELFDTVQNLFTQNGHFNRNNTTEYAKQPYIFRKMIHCKECGGLITPETKVKKGKKYVYLGCRGRNKECSQRSISLNENIILEQIKKEVLDKITLPLNLQESLQKIITKDLTDTSVFNRNIKANITSKLTELKVKEDKLLDFYLEGKLPQAAYDKRQEQIEKERQELEKTAEKYKTIDTDMKQKVIDVMAMTSNISTIFERANITEKQNLLKLLITDCKMNGRKLEYKILQPFDKLIKCSEYKQWSAVAITYLDEFEKLPV